MENNKYSSIMQEEMRSARIGQSFLGELGHPDFDVSGSILDCTYDFELNLHFTFYGTYICFCVAYQAQDEKIVISNFTKKWDHPYFCSWIQVRQGFVSYGEKKLRRVQFTTLVTFLVSSLSLISLLCVTIHTVVSASLSGKCNGRLL
jgi:hypothetical protein